MTRRNGMGRATSLARSTAVIRSTAAAVLLWSTAAQADVTAAQVWQDWQTYTQSFGQTLKAGSEEMSGDTLTLSDIAITMTMPDGSMTGAMGAIMMKELGDGTVEVTMSPEYPLVFKTQPEGGEAVEMNMLIKMPGTKMIVSGDETKMGYAISAPETNFVLNGLMVDGKPVELKVDVSLKNTVGNYSSVTGDVREILSDLVAESLTFTVSATDPEGTGTFSMTGTMADLTSSGMTRLPTTVAMDDMPAMMAAGFAVDGKLGYGKTDYAFELVDAGKTTSASGTAESGGLTFALDQDRLTYGGSTLGTAVTATSPDMPFPVNLSIAEAAFNLMMPVAKSDTAQDFLLMTRLVDASVNDEIWALFDPTGVLPHDPATIIIDTKGTARWLVDIMDPKAAEAAPEMPGEVQSIDITELRAKAVGADLTGTGSFTFDNTDTVTFPGMPKPVGTASLKLVGGNALLDKLVQMGLIPEDQAMGARMMLGLFARPGEGEDTLVSEIEVKADGSVMANGQRLK